MMDNNKHDTKYILKQKNSPELPSKAKSQTVSFINNEIPSIILSGLQPLRSNSQDDKSTTSSESLASKIVNLNILNKEQKIKKDKKAQLNNHEKLSNSIFYLSSSNLRVYDLENPPNKIKYKSSKSMITNTETNESRSTNKKDEKENIKINLLEDTGNDFL